MLESRSEYSCSPVVNEEETVYRPLDILLLKGCGRSLRGDVAVFMTLVVLV